jgi:hypothetical protein
MQLEVRSESGQSGYPVIHPKFDRIRIDPVVSPDWPDGSSDIRWIKKKFYSSDWPDGSPDIWSIRWIKKIFFFLQKNSWNKNNEKSKSEEGEEEEEEEEEEVTGKWLRLV